MKVGECTTVYSPTLGTVTGKIISINSARRYITMEIQIGDSFVRECFRLVPQQEEIIEQETARRSSSPWYKGLDKEQQIVERARLAAEVVRLKDSGLSTAQVVAKLGISEYTVYKFYREAKRSNNFV